MKKLTKNTPKVVTLESQYLEIAYLFTPITQQNNCSLEQPIPLEIVDSITTFGIIINK